jgi:hypothetical protein
VVDKPEKPCPFCGGTRLVICEAPCAWHKPPVAYSVSCTTRDCHGAIWSLGYDLFETKEQAIAAWNRRPELAMTDEPATARAEIAALTEDRRSWRAVAERLEGEKQALRAQVERLTTVTEDDVEAKWMALKQRVCADPVKAVRCVMVTRADFRAALMAHTARGE